VLTLEVELLTGRYAATAHDNRRRAEWPPHPARFFSALVAALHDHDPVDSTERAALLWLETQPPPALDVDLDVDERVGRRDVHDVFVPVNDISVVGDVWPLVDELAKAEAALIAAEQEGNAKTRARDVKTASKAVATAEKKLSTFLVKALARRDEPSTVELNAAVALMPERRTRQVRTFPVALPGRKTFSLIWSADPGAELRAALDKLCRRVTRLGHSSSLVRCAVADRDVNPTLVPAKKGDWVLRVIGAGQLARLESEFARHEAVESRVLPSLPQTYARPARCAAPEPPRSMFTDEWIIYERRAGARVLSSRATDVTRALRAALLEANGSAGPLPSVLSGHRSNGEPSRAPHVAFIACPFIGHAYADGSVQGCAIVPPRDIGNDERQSLLRLIASWENRTARDGLVELAGEDLPPLRLARVGVSEKQALSPWKWCRPSTRFITATPIALDRNPGNLRSSIANAANRASVEAQRLIAEACEHIGLPRPISVEINLAPLVIGAQHVREFRPWPSRPGRPARVRVHADITFDRPVRGPVILGAGRYFGLGLCLPAYGRDDR